MKKLVLLLLFTVGMSVITTALFGNQANVGAVHHSSQASFVNGVNSISLINQAGSVIKLAIANNSNTKTIHLVAGPAGTVVYDPSVEGAFGDLDKENQGDTGVLYGQKGSTVTLSSDIFLGGSVVLTMNKNTIVGSMLANRYVILWAFHKESFKTYEGTKKYVPSFWQFTVFKPKAL